MCGFLICVVKKFEEAIGGALAGGGDKGGGVIGDEGREFDSCA